MPRHVTWSRMACDIRLFFDLIPQNRSFLDLTTVSHFYLLLSVFHLIKVPAIAWLSSTITMQPSTKPKAQDITMQVLLPKRFGLYCYLLYSIMDCSPSLFLLWLQGSKHGIKTKYPQSLKNQPNQGIQRMALVVPS